MTTVMGESLILAAERARVEAARAARLVAELV
jgi:hypothetical protein